MTNIEYLEEKRARMRIHSAGGAWYAICATILVLLTALCGIAVTEVVGIVENHSRPLAGKKEIGL